MLKKVQLQGIYSGRKQTSVCLGAGGLAGVAGRKLSRMM